MSSHHPSEHDATLARTLPYVVTSVRLSGIATKHDLPRWVQEALAAQGGGASIVDVCRHVWQVHEPDLRQAGDLFYTWQYDVRWAAYHLREHGVMKPERESPKGTWELAERTKPS